MSSVPKTFLSESALSEAALSDSVLSDSVLSDSVLSEAAIAAPIAVPIGPIALARLIATRGRAGLLAAMLFLVPLVAYGPATFHDYGLRDDSSKLREAHE